MSALLQTSLPSVSRNPPQEVALAPLLARMRNRSAALEQRNLLEQGQSEFWMLVGSTCTQQPSTPLSAATNALWLRAAASFTPVVNGVRIEPWLSTRGLALLGHAAHSGTESPKALATRVANSLGRVLAASRMSIQDFAQLRSQLVTSLSRSADAGWWWGLDAITAHQSWRIEPHTTPNGLAALPLNGLPSSRVWRLAEPLRMATLSNRNPGQAVAAANALGPWLLPFEPGSLTCVDAPALEWRFGEHPIPVEVPHSRGLAYVAIPLSARLPGVAGLVATLLNRSFERTFEPNVEGLRVSAESFNDTNNAVLLVKIATPPADLIQATAQVRSALQNLALGMVTAQDFAWATERLAQLERVRRLDPRFRISELWTAVPSAPIRLSDLQNELGSLRPERHLVVLPAGEIR